MTFNKKPKLTVLVFLFILLFSQASYSQRTKSSLSAGNQRHSEKSLKDNVYFFYFLNTTISNSGTDEEKNLYIEAARRDIIARMLYMKFSFDPAMNEIKKAQQLLITLSSGIALREIDDALSLLNEIAPEVLETGNKASKKYMSLGYRSVDSAKKVMIMSDNLPEKNYSIRIYEYVKAIKSAKYAKRFAIISLIYSRTPEEKRGKINYNRYDTVKNMIDLYIPENIEKYSLVHLDNFYKIKAVPSVYDRFMDNPELEKIPEYIDYKRDH